MNTNKEIWNELEEISPLLYQIRKEAGNPFTVPEGYFGGLKEDVFRMIDTGLADEVGKQAFSVPDDYFEKLTTDIMDRIEDEGNVIDLNAHRRREHFSVRRWTVMAASVAIFLLLGVLSARFFINGGNDIPEFAITQEDAYEYIEDNWSEFESEDLFALVDFSDKDISHDMTDGLEEELQQYLEEHIDELDEYLLTNEI